MAGKFLLSEGQGAIDRFFPKDQPGACRTGRPAGRSILEAERARDTVCSTEENMSLMGLVRTISGRTLSPRSRGSGRPKIGAFQRVTANPNKKNSPGLKLCAERLKRIFLAFSPRRTPARGAGSALLSFAVDA